MKRQELTGLLLAGGRGRRVGGKDKGLLTYQGTPLVELQLQWLKPQVSEILVSANRNFQEYHRFGFPVLSDESASFDGPLAGVARGLDEACNPWLFSLPVDQPELPAGLLSDCFESVKCGQKPRYLASRTRAHYANMFLRKDDLGKLKEFLKCGNRKIQDFLSAIDARPLVLPVPEEYFRNLNTPADFE